MSKCSNLIRLCEASKEYTVRPETKENLLEVIHKTIVEQGFYCSLNFIDTSLITNMSYLFANDQNSPIDMSRFNGDISKWDVSNVTDMTGMFYRSQFNRDISKWDVSNVKDMRYMFFDARFNGNLSKWRINSECNTRVMFKYSPLKDEYGENAENLKE